MCKVYNTAPTTEWVAIRKVQFTSTMRNGHPGTGHSMCEARPSSGVSVFPSITCFLKKIPFQELPVATSHVGWVDKGPRGVSPEEVSPFL